MLIATFCNGWPALKLIDCLEMAEIPVPPIDNPKQLVMEVGSLIGVDLNDNHISTAHRLPDTKKTNNRIIVKFVNRDKREEMYKKKSKLHWKKSSELPTIHQKMGKSITNNYKVHINESLTSYRKRLFGRINAFKWENKFKFLWTSNGKILLRESELFNIIGFISHKEFDDYLDQFHNK